MAEPTSIWKKELTLRRRKPTGSAAPKVAPPVTASAPPAQSRRESPAPALPAGKEKTSVWKREISFRKLSPAPRRSATETPTPVAVPSQPVAPAKRPSILPVARPVAGAFLAPADVAPDGVAPAEVSSDLDPAEAPAPAPAAAVPPPKARKKPGSQTGQVVGLRIGSSQIVAALIDNGPDGPELVQLARSPLPRGVVVAGEVRDPGALASALKELFVEHKLPRRAVRVGIASNRIGVRTLEVPAIADPKLLENAIRFRAQELLSIPLSDAVLDHFVIGDAVTPEGPGHKVLLAFAHRELIDCYVEACKGARLKLIGIDFDAFALLRAVGEPPEAGTAPDRATVAVAIGHERTIFAVAEGEVCDYTRVLEWGGSSLTVGLARALNLTPSQAEPIKLGLSLEGELPGGDVSAVQLEAGREAMRSELQVLARELLASLQYYQSRPGSLAIGEILLTGGAAQLTGIEAQLERLLGVSVRQADPYRHVEVGKKAVRLGEPGSVSIAIGLGING